MTDDNQSNETKGKISRRKFLKYSAGVAAVAAGAVAMIDKISLAANKTGQASTQTSTGAPMVVAVHGDELTLISGDRSVKVKDSVLAAALASRSQEEE